MRILSVRNESNNKNSIFCKTPKATPSFKMRVVDGEMLADFVQFLKNNKFKKQAVKNIATTLDTLIGDNITLNIKSSKQTVVDSNTFFGLIHRTIFEGTVSDGKTTKEFTITRHRDWPEANNDLYAKRVVEKILEAVNDLPNGTAVKDNEPAGVSSATVFDRIIEEKFPTIKY